MSAEIRIWSAARSAASKGQIRHPEGELEGQLLSTFESGAFAPHSKLSPPSDL
jgi:hypothetical protein